ncbi:hypothetical protein ACFR9U_13805 [Halorientalis brevis]|uniref:Uncharacterized protein n=1 Tax=Halorientalis brevis TaxID=1126241 RepID=A0ABD6CDH8_9EURY
MTIDRRVQVVGLLVALCLSTGAAVAVPSEPTPPEEPEHGLNNSTFYPLWSNDDDVNITANQTGYAALANGTDLSYHRPPAAVETWNQRDLEEFPVSSTNTSASIIPRGTKTSSSSKGWIKDAYVELFAIQPSTQMYINPDRQPLYVPSNGTILGTIDYRVSLPADDTSGDRRVSWSLNSAQITTVQAVSGYRTIGTTTPDHTVSVEYSGLTPGQHPVGLEAEISLTATKTVRTKHCNEEGSCHWETSSSTHSDQLTVRKTRQVTQYQVLASGFYTRYPNGDLGLVVHRNLPWAALKFPNGDSADGVWRFYSGRRTGWDSLSIVTADGTGTVSSPANPLQTYAYPDALGPTASAPEGVSRSPNTTLLHSQGEEMQAPSLPANVSMFPVTGTYNTSWQLAVRHPNARPETVRMVGVVRGTGTNISTTFFEQVETSESNLSATILETTRANMTLRIELRDSQGTPISTTDYEGKIHVGNYTIDTNASGVAVVTIPKTTSRVHIRYEPTPFWKRVPTYTGSETVVSPSTSFSGPMAPLMWLIWSMLVFFSPFYFFDKILGTNIWPPWRGIW